MWHIDILETSWEIFEIERGDAALCVALDVSNAETAVNTMRNMLFKPAKTVLLPCG